jgi:hypothetical protein
MNSITKIALAFLAILVMSLAGGYFYFESKFAPPENYLTVSGMAENVPMTWLPGNGNPHVALLLPIQISGVEQTLYMQVDFGSPVTVLYKKTLKSVWEKLQQPIQFVDSSRSLPFSFDVKGMNISSASFRLLNHGEAVDFDDPTAVHVIGTIGTDLLEKKTTVLDFENSQCSFVGDLPGDDFTSFRFKKRRILMPAKIGSQELELLYDSGTSGYELITSKDEWEKYKVGEEGKRTENGNSWGTTLKVISARADQLIQFGGRQLRLSEVTYIEGTSLVQNLLMMLSGMDGMIGNKLFLHHTLILDCKNERFKIE